VLSLVSLTVAQVVAVGLATLQQQAAPAAMVDCTAEEAVVAVAE
jgi:hypothetical protein